MVLGNFIVEVVISFGPEDPSVATDRVEVTLRDTDPGESPKTIQTKLDVDYIWRRRHLLYWETLDPKYLKNTIMNRAYPRS